MSTVSAPGRVRAIQPVTVPLSAAVVRRLMPRLADSLAGGPALLPLPAGPEALVDRISAALRPDEPVDEPAAGDDPVALVVPTSGSEGEPKGVLLSAAALRASAAAVHARLGGPGRWLLALPATHVAGLQVLVRSVLTGTEPVAVDLTAGFDPDAFAAATVRLMADSSPRKYTSLVPTQLERLLDDGRCGMHAARAFDAVLLGGAAASPELLDRARTAGVPVVTTYGLTETCGGCVYDGVPLDGVRVDVSEADGRIRIAGPVLASGYRRRPDLTAGALSDGWLTTTDAGRIGPDGRLSVTGRLDDVAVTGGENVPLAAVEAHVGSHPAVREAAAVALPDPEWGQRIVVAVVPSDPAVAPTAASVRAHVQRRAAASHAPREIVVVADLPRSPSGKVDRRATAELVAGHATGHG
jgi:O-succinylbenzoic acid--CoA ligase